MRVTGIAVIAVLAGVVGALAQPPAHGPGRATTRAHTAQKAKAPEATHPDAMDEADGMEPMDGPDAWDRFDMGPAGLLVPGPRGGAPKAGGMMRLHALRAHRRALERQLELTPDQLDRIRAIRERQLRAGIEQRARLRIAALDLRALMRDDASSRTALEARINDIARLRAELTRARLQALLDMRGVLTREQQKKLRALRDELGSGGEI